MGDFDHLLTSPEYAQNPYPVYRQLREQAPVYWSDLWGCWILTRYDDITASLQDYQHFTSLGRLTATMDLPEPLWEQVQPLIRHYSQGLINVDPPAHTRMRQLVHQAFTPRTIRKMAGYVETIVDSLIRDVIDQGQMDIIWDFSYPLPVRVIAELMGIPLEDHERFKAWSGKIVEFMATPKPQPEVLLGSQAALMELQQYFRDIFRQRRASPQDDLISALVAVEAEGDRLTEEELVSTCVTILIGGHETTTNLIASGMLALIQHPGEMQRLRESPELAPSAVEEFLRYEGPFQRNRRIATEDVILGDQYIRKGQLVMQMLGAANRDPSHFPDPDRLDITREPNKHLAFGYGPHFCLGASLARLEAPIAIQSLMKHLSDIQLATADVVWINTVFRGLKSLPVTFIRKVSP
ncbi:MAG: cytochrome P450 [Anaerolineae bacterium]|nr:cytochrome P450 [Anaerolineae bacterium]